MRLIKYSMNRTYQSVFKGFYNGNVVDCPNILSDDLRSTDKIDLPVTSKSAVHEVLIINQNAPDSLKNWRHVSHAKTEKQAKSQAVFKYAELFKAATKLNKSIPAIISELSKFSYFNVSVEGAAI